MKPIFHLSFPVADLAEATAFYSEQLGATIGRRTETFVDVLLFGAQVTLQNDPEEAAKTTPRTRHFGATVDWTAWEDIAAQFEDRAFIVEAPTISYAGESIEQGKMMIADPSGNLIEIKAYRQPDAVLGVLAGDP